MRATTLFAAACLLTAGLSPGAGAAIKQANRNPAGACMLSIPASNAGARPKATGFRNEGEVNSFVICTFDAYTDDPNAGFLNLALALTSIDGATHEVSCTAMDRLAASSTGEYLTKTNAVVADGFALFSYFPVEFPTTGLGGLNASITCNLPPGTSIITMYGSFDESGD